MSQQTMALLSPWYRQRWPWLLMLGPALVLVAGSYTMWLAYSTDDGLVARDYYKRGLVINRTLQQDHNAASLGLAAQGAWNANGTSFTLQISGLDAPPRSPRLHLTSGAGIESTAALADIGGGWYAAVLARPSGHAWRAEIETEDWRLTSVPMTAQGSLRFVAADR